MHVHDVGLMVDSSVESIYFFKDIIADFFHAFVFWR